MSNIWTFGCSYTQGFGYDNKFETDGIKYRLSDEQINYHWLPTLQQLYKHDTGVDYGIVNKGCCGAGMKHILYNLLNNLPNIKPGDIMVLGSTFYDRESYISNLHHKDFHQVIITPKLQQQWYDNKLRDDFIFPGKSKEYNDLLVAHYTENSFEHSENGYNYLEVEGEFLERTFRNICDLLESTGVRCYRWNRYLWDHFETIEEWTEGIIKNQHWSPNGDRKAARFFYWCINNGYKTFSHYLLPQCIEKNLNGKNNELDGFNINDFPKTEYDPDLYKTII